MNYTQLPITHKYDTLAEAIYAREMEFFHYDFDRRNFEYLLGVATDAQYVANIQERLESTLVQMQHVEHIYNALLAQIEDQKMYQAAVVRMAAKREKENAK